MQNLSTFWFPHNGQFRVRESSDHRVAGQLLVTLFHSFEENVFHMSLEMEEIGNPSVSLLSLIDQSDMLNSPPLSPVVRHYMELSESWQACRKEVVYRVE